MLDAYAEGILHWLQQIKMTNYYNAIKQIVDMSK